MRYALCLVLLAPLASPAFADKRDDALAEIQRDIAAMDERVRDVQKAQGVQADKIEALHSLIQQAATAATQASQDVSALKAALTTNLADQQTKISGAVAPLGSRMDALSTSMDQLNATIGAFSDRLTKIDKKLSDLTDQVSALKQAPPPPPPAGIVPDATSIAPGATAAPASGVPPGISKQGLQEDASNDYYAKRDDLAVTELANYVKYFPTDSWAPTAGYLMGMVYKRGKDYDSATQAFQSVIDNYPGNNQSQNALYQKALAYSLWPGHRTEAIQAFSDFIHMYPVNDNIPAAQAELAKLKTTSRTGKKKPAASRE